jgi:hypothetical protein
MKYGSRERTKDRVVIPSDLKPPKEFKTFLQVNIKTGDIIRRRKGLTSEDIDSQKWS